MLQKPPQSNLSWLLTAIRFGLYAVLFMPLIVSSSFIFPYIFPKQAFFQIVVEIIFGLYLFLAMRDPQYRPRSSKLLWAMLAYFCLLILSSVFGLNSYHSFWSNYERMAGVISLWHYFGFLFIAVNVFKGKNDWHRFFDVSIIASFLQALYGLGQLAKIFTSSGGVRLDGTIGNASFLAGYLLINALFAFWLLLEKKNFKWRIFYLATIFLNLLILYETETRGAILALVFSLIISALFFVFAPAGALGQLSAQNNRIKKYALAGLVAFCLVIVLMLVFRDSGFIKNRPTLNRITHISSAETTGQTRLLSWRMSLKGFKERPLFGWGPENYYILFNKYYDPHLYPAESWFDRSHNAYLDVLVNTGTFGFAAYIAIFVLAFWYLWRSWRERQVSYYTAVMFTVILIAYGIQNIFVFDTQVTLLLIYAILGFIVFLSLKPQEQAGQPFRASYFLLLLVVLGVFGAVYLFNWKPALASKTGIKAMLYFQQNQTTEGFAEFKKAYDIDTFGLPEIALRAYDMAMQVLSNPANANKSETKEIVALAVDGLKKALEIEPLNVRFMMMLGNLYLLAAQADNSYLNEADLILSRALELSPTRQELYFSLGQLRTFQGRIDQVLPMFKKAVELNDTVIISHWNYGVLAIALGQKQLGEAEIGKAVELGYEFKPQDIQRLINAYERTSDWPHIIALYEKWIQLTPNDATPYARLAATYAQAGDKQKAKEYALRAAQMDPSFQAGAEQFIKGLGL